MGKVVRLITPSAENENTQWEAPVIKETGKTVTTEQRTSADTSQSQLLGVVKEKKSVNDRGEWTSNAFGKHWKKMNNFACLEACVVRPNNKWTTGVQQVAAEVAEQNSMGGILTAETPKLTLSQEVIYVQVNPGSQKNRSFRKKTEKLRIDMKDSNSAMGMIWFWTEKNNNKKKNHSSKEALLHPGTKN